jgi:hypothetical protein
MKFVPFTVRVKAGPPTVALAGMRVVTVGTGFPPGSIMRFNAFEVPPPGVGVKTLTAAVPAVAMSAAEMAALSCVLLTKVVGRSAPFQRTTELLMKRVPFTVKVKAGPPAVTLSGESEIMNGKGFCWGRGV